MAAGRGVPARRPEVGLRDAIAPEAPGKVGKGRGVGTDLLQVAAGAERAGAGMGHVQAVQEAHRAPWASSQPAK